MGAWTGVVVVGRNHILVVKLGRIWQWIRCEEEIKDGNSFDLSKDDNVMS